MCFSSSSSTQSTAPSVCAGFPSLAILAVFYCWFLNQLLPKSCQKRRGKVIKPDSNHNTIILRTNLKSFCHQNKCLKLRISSSQSRKKNPLSYSLQDIRSEQIIALFFISIFCPCSWSKYSMNWSLRPRYFPHPSNKEPTQKGKHLLLLTTTEFLSIMPCLC